MSARPALVGALFLLALRGTTALACGQCVEDKIAAAYDHAVVVRALGARHQVAFFALEGRVAGREGLKRDIERALESIRGVDRGSTRVSLENASVSFAFDPAHGPLGTVLRAAQGRLASKGLSLAPLRVMDQPAQLKAANPIQ